MYIFHLFGVQYLLSEFWWQFVKSKESRTQIHKTIRELFKGNLISETETSGSQSDSGYKIAIMWAGDAERNVGGPQF